MCLRLVLAEEQHKPGISDGKLGLSYIAICFKVRQLHRTLEEYALKQL